MVSYELACVKYDARTLIALAGAIQAEAGGTAVHAACRLCRAIEHGGALHVIGRLFVAPLNWESPAVLRAVSSLRISTTAKP